MKYIVLLGRILFSLIFLQSVAFHFTGGAVDYADAAGVPVASLLVPFSGILAFLGALSIILGYKARWGAWLIVIFLLPVTFFMHAFWQETDPMQAQMQTSMFFKNLSMLGAAFMITYFGSGPLSLDNKFKSKTEKDILFNADN